MRDTSNSCLTTQASGTNDATLTSDAVNNINAALDIPSKSEEEPANASKAISLQDKATTSPHPVCLAVELAQASSLVEESKDITGLESENAQQKEAVKDLLRSVSRNNDLADSSSEDKSICKDKITNNSEVGNCMVNEKSALSPGHAGEAFSNKGNISESPEEENDKQNVCAVPADGLKEAGHNISSGSSVVAESQSFSAGCESAMPTADVSVLS